MLKAYKYRLYPNKSQIEMLAKHFGSNRFVYNWALNKKIEFFKQNNKSLSCFDLMKQLTKMKHLEEFKWLEEIDSQSLQQTLNNLDKAYTKFFREKKGFPKFKAKHDNCCSYQIPQRVKTDFDNHKIQIPKIGKVKSKLSQSFEGIIRTATISKTPTNKYFVSVLVENHISLPEKSKIEKSSAIGIDLGIKDFAVCSNGQKFENPKYLNNSLKRLKILQKRASKKQKGSQNRRKANLKVSRQYEKITNKRKDFLHKLSSKLVSENQTICLENLSIKDMLKNKHLSQLIQDCSWREFISMLEYKSEWNGKNILKIGKFDPSSKMCSSCGNINNELKLSDRVWKCAKCGTIHDRDINASKNILDFGFSEQNLVYTGSGRSSELVEMCSLEQSMKQES